MTEQNKKYKLFQNEIIAYPHTPPETLARDKKRVSQHLNKSYQVFATTPLSLYPMRSRN